MQTDLERLYAEVIACEWHYKIESIKAAGEPSYVPQPWSDVGKNRRDLLAETFAGLITEGIIRRGRLFE